MTAKSHEITNQDAVLAAAPESGPQLLISSLEAARRLGVSERTLWELTRRGEIVSVRIGRSVRYSVKYLEQWVLDRSGLASSKP